VLDYVLRNIGIDAPIVGGFLTDQCVDHTVRDGADRGYEMICVTDGCTEMGLGRIKSGATSILT
jgi:nicotinamidase-related amidase